MTREGDIMSLSISVRTIAVLIALALIGAVLAVTTVTHRSATAVDAKSNPGSGCVLVTHKVGKQPGLHTTICLPDIDTSIAHRAPAFTASAPTGTGCFTVAQKVNGRTSIHTKICIPNGPIR
jgi:hypothetical protein